VLLQQYLKSPECLLCDEEFCKMTSLELAISIASLSTMANGNRHPHQYRISKHVLLELKEKLLAISQSIRDCKSFDELHNLVLGVCDSIHGAGELLSYDVAQRIGEGFLKLPPEFVYLHADAKQGARYLGVKSRVASVECFPMPLRSLTPDHLESFLCIFKNEIHNLVFSNEAV